MQNNTSATWKKWLRLRSGREIFLLLLIGVIVGGVVKWNVAPLVTMGYEDYLVTNNDQDFDYKEMATALAEEGKTNAGTVAGVATGASCGQ